MSDDRRHRSKIGRLFSRGISPQRVTRGDLLRAVSLPILVAAVWGALVLLAERHRNALVAQLSDVAVHGDTDEAAAAVQQLSHMPHPPMELLVAAATSPTRGVAIEAQTAINDLVQQWYRQVKTGNNQRRVADQLTSLVEALARQQPAFSTADYPWLDRLTRRILRLANELPAEMSLSVAAQCEMILANVEPADAAVVAFTSTSPVVRVDEGIAAALATSAPVAWSPDQRERPVDSLPNPLRHVTGPRATGSSSAEVEGALADQPPVAPLTDGGPSSDDVIAPVAIAPTEPRSADAESALASIQTRPLLARWLVADAASALELEQELARRGFGRLPARMVERLVSPDAESRRSLVADLLAQPGVDARPWLILLASDENADVRLAAVSMMATSDDPQLIEAAWQAALHDRDPRVADLAPRLRARQASLQQR